MFAVLTSISFANTLIAQDISWAKSTGGLSYEYSKSIAVDNDGNVYTTGIFVQTMDFDPGAGEYSLTSAGFNDIFLSKLDASGNFKWAIHMGGPEYDYGNSVAVDKDGNIFVTGEFQGDADFTPNSVGGNLTSHGANDIFIAKYDSSGNYLWAKGIGGTSYDGGKAITTDIFGNIYVTGFFNDSVAFNLAFPGIKLGTDFNENAFVLKLDNNGGYMTALNIGGNDDAEGYDVAVDTLLNIYLTGAFSGTVDFDPSGNQKMLTSTGETYPDMFAVKIFPSGVAAWAMHIGEEDDDYGYSIAADDDGGVYITGNFRGNVDFSPGIGIDTINGGGVFILKLDQFGEYVWANNFGEGSGNSIILDRLNNVLCAGSFSGSADFDPGPDTFLIKSNSFSGDIFISKLDSDGNFISAKVLGGSGSEDVNDIASDDLGNIYITGVFTAETDFEPANPGQFILNANGGVDIFVAKYQSFMTPVARVSSEDKYLVYPNPITDEVNIQTDFNGINTTFTLHDQLGRRILSGTLHDKNTSIDLSYISKGLYFFKFEGNPGKVYKVIKL